MLSGRQLSAAAEEVLAGLYEADLGGGVCKKRIALQGRGKSGSARVLVAMRCEAAVFFLAGRLKSDPGTDFSDRQVEAAKIIAARLQSVTAAKLDELLVSGWIKEIGDG